MPPLLNKAKTVKRLDPYAQLPKSVRKKVKRLVKLAKINGTIPRGSQQTIPYVQMLRNGLCHVKGDYYTKTVEFFDINYRLAKRETKEGIFDNWCKFLNYFDCSVSVQLSFINKKIDLEEIQTAIFISETGDVYDEFRTEYMSVLQDCFSKGNNGIVKRKFITFGVHAENTKAAQQQLDRIETEIIGSFKQMKVSAFHCNGYQRLEIMHDLLNIGTDRKLNFNWELIAKTGLTTKDFIAPNSFSFKKKNIFELQKCFGRSSFMQITAPELYDDTLSELLDLDTPLAVSIHIRSIDQTEALKQAKSTKTDIQKMIIEEQKKAYQGNYSPDMLPPDLITYNEEADNLITNLQSRNERMFLITFTLVNFAEAEDELLNIYDTAKQIVQQHGCELLPLDWQQEAGLMSTLPIGVNHVEIERMLTTSSVAIFVPFQTQELFQKGGLYYGANAVSGNMIMIDRLTANAPNGLILGTPGSGKSFSSKREIVNVFLVCSDDILILDPEREYMALVEALGGQVIIISADSPHHINPMDLNIAAKNTDDDKFNPLRDKFQFIMSFIEQVMAVGDEGLYPIEKSVISRCVELVYQGYLKDPRPENMPILGDLSDLLEAQPEPESKRIAAALELYVTGSFNVFNHQTNVEIDNRIVCFDTKDLGDHLKSLGMLTVQDQIWSRVRTNRAKGKITRYYADEFHLLLTDGQTASASVAIWKRFRKWGGVPTGITQNVSDFLLSPQIKNIFSNSDFVYLLNQASSDQRILAQELNISEDQLSYVTNSQPGEGLLIFSGTIIPFVDRFPKDTKLYRLMTTKLDEVTV